MRRLVANCLVAVVSTTAAKPTKTTTAKPTSLVVVHHYGEGSHAFVDHLNRYPCTRFYVREQISAWSAALREFFAAPTIADIPAAYGLSLSNESKREPALDPADVSNVRIQSRQDSNLIPSADEVNASIHKLRHTTNEYVNLSAEKETLEKTASGDYDAIECACESRGLLVRTSSAEDTADDWCENKDALFGAETGFPSLARVVVLVRLDLLRHAVSSYGRTESGLRQNPQFQLLAQPNASLVDLQGRVTYNLTLLQHSVNAALNVWAEDAILIQRLTACGIAPLVSAYEAFDDAGLPDDFGPSLVADCAGDRDDARWRDFSTRYITSGVEDMRKAHSYRLSENAENTREIWNWFTQQKYPTFAQVAETEANLDVSALEWI